MNPHAQVTSPEPPSPQRWTGNLARQGSLGGSKRRVIRIKETT